MDHQKTGALIAARRKELTLTQKELAQQLNISDRTVSKWERGAGFPDLALLEPLADALGLSVLELMHGERTPMSQPEAEQSARDTVQSLRSVLKAGLKKARIWIIILSVLLIFAATALIFLITYPDRYFVVSGEETSAAQAVELCPFILITTEEYELRSKILADEGITSLCSEDATLTVGEALSAPYRNLVQINGEFADTFQIEVIGHNIYVDFYSGSHRCILTFLFDGTISKLYCEYDENKTPYYVVENHDNATFICYGENRDLLFPFRNESHDF